MRWGRSRQGADSAGQPVGQASRTTAADLRRYHLLLVPSTVSVTEVSRLVASRTRAGDGLDRNGEARFGRSSRLFGPIELSMEDAVDADVPLPWTMVYALDAPVEREDPPLPDLDDRDGFSAAFPEGMPWREEERGLRLIVGIARRLHGAVRVSGNASGRLIHPDPDRAMDVSILSPTWLDPEVTLSLVRRTRPDAALAVDGADWHGPAQEVYSGEAIFADLDEDHLTQDELDALHHAADQVDIETLSAEDTVDAYAVVADLGVPLPRGRHSAPAPNGVEGGTDGALEVMVHVSEPGEPALIGLDWANHAFVSYQVRWAPPDLHDAERRHPSAEHLAARERVRPMLRGVAHSLVEALEGVVLDEDGFPLDRYSL